MNRLIPTVFAIYSFIGLSFCCDQFSLIELRSQYDSCVENRYTDLQKTLNSSQVENDQEFCRAWELYEECADYLQYCSDFYYQNVEKKTELDAISSRIAKCYGLKNVRDLIRDKRSPRKSSGGSSGRGRSTVSRVASSVRKNAPKVIKGILNKRKQGSGVSRVGGAAAAAGGTALKKKKSKSGILKKVGGVAVAGLAGYGAYKLAKKMSKALKFSYDNDDCWEYNAWRDSYECQCPGQCNVYVGSGPLSSVISGTCMIMGIVLSTIFAQRRLI